MGSDRRLEEVGDDVVADTGQHGFGMELDALDGVLAVADTHYERLARVGGGRRHLEAVGDVDGDERVVPPPLEPLVEAVEDAPAVVVDGEGMPWTGSGARSTVPPYS